MKTNNKKDFKYTAAVISHIQSLTSKEGIQTITENVIEKMENENVGVFEFEQIKEWIIEELTPKNIELEESTKEQMIEQLVPALSMAVIMTLMRDGKLNVDDCTDEDGNPFFGEEQEFEETKLEKMN